MPDPYRSISTRVTPQREPIPGTVPNSAGGHSFPLGDLDRLRRFLILGSEGGTYYTKEADLTKDNAATIQRLIAAGRGVEAVNEITTISVEGRNPKQKPVVFALAVCAGAKDRETSKAALAALPTVCRTGYQLFLFARYVEQFRGWGRALKRAVANWYLDKPIDDLVYQLMKYKQREGWSHRDLLRLSKPRPPRGSDHDGALAWAVGKAHENIPVRLSASDAATTVETVLQHRLPWETWSNDLVAKPGAWKATLPTMPMGALVRNLVRLTKNGALKPLSNEAITVEQRLVDPDAIKRSRLHPISVLMAATTYATTDGAIGSLLFALERAFRLAFGNVTPANKRTLIALDVSSSMGWGSIAGTTITPAMGAAAMCLVTLETEPKTHVVGFERELVHLPLLPGMTLEQAMRVTASRTFGGTDCAQPMIYALKHGLEVDTFIVYTDNETWAGRMHPVQALRQYREKTGINAKLIVVGMTSTGFTIADPSDSGMLDVVGFDAAAPQLIADFSAGRV
jgi:60 kDa SS-A/Ro ribonucleoprotein